MKYLKLHPWNVSYKKAAEIQEELEKNIILKAPEKKINLIAGADVSYLPENCIQLPERNPARAYKKKSYVFFASVVVFELQTMQRVEAVTASGRVDFPYIPGLLSFRESPILLKAITKIKSEPDAIILDAQGIAHPRGIGLASHIGLILDKPSIGCAKTRLIGEYNKVGKEVGDYTTAYNKRKGRQRRA
jgi:deoxyribonuclease V